MMDLLFHRLRRTRTAGRIPAGYEADRTDRPDADILRAADLQAVGRFESRWAGCGRRTASPATAG